MIVVLDQFLPQAPYKTSLWNNTIAGSASLLAVFYLFSLIMISEK